MTRDARFHIGIKTSNIIIQVDYEYGTSPISSQLPRSRECSYLDEYKKWTKTKKNEKKSKILKTTLAPPFYGSKATMDSFPRRLARQFCKLGRSTVHSQFFVHQPTATEGLGMLAHGMLLLSKLHPGRSFGKANWFLSWFIVMWMSTVTDMSIIWYRWPLVKMRTS